MTSSTATRTRRLRRLATRAGQVRAHLARRRLLHVLMHVGVFALLLGSTAVFLPLASAPDEAAHYVYAAAVVRGQAGQLDVTVPASIAAIHDLATCIAFQVDVTAVCQNPFEVDSTATVSAQTHLGLYNPVYYAFTGLGSLLLPDEHGLYVSRLLSVLLVASVLGWATSLLARATPSAWPIAGLYLAVTPMVTYIGSVLNPNGLEIVATIAVTISGWYVLHAAGRSGGFTEGHALLLVAGSLLLVSRGLSPLIAALVALGVAVCAGWRSLMGTLRDRATWPVLAGLAIVGGASVLWIVRHGTNYVGVTPPASLSDGITSIPIYFDGLDRQLNQMVGQLGWLELPAPPLVALGWLAVASGFVLVSFVVAGRRQRWAIVAAVTSAVLIPGVLAGLQWSGLGWQGRYTLPFVVATILLAGLAAADRLHGASSSSNEVSHRMLSVAAVGAPLAFVAGHVVIAGGAVHRYTVGASAPLGSPAVWLPPVPLAVLSVLFLAALLAMAVLPRPTPRAAAQLDGAHPAAGASWPAAGSRG